MTSGLSDRLQTSSVSKWKMPQCPLSCLPRLVGCVDLWMCLGGCGQEPPGSGLCSLSFTQHQALSEYRPICEARQLQRGSPASMADKKLILIPLIFICLRVWSTVRFILTLCGSPAVKSPVLVVLHVCLSPWALLPHCGMARSLPYRLIHLRSQDGPMGSGLAQCPFPVPKQAWLCS